jgi:hypothetical protein
MGRIISIILIAATIAFSASWWVHSDGGNDAWPGTSPDSAFATLGAATTSMSAGDSCMACGTFHETLTLSNGSHEGCSFGPWPDSTRWTIDGDTVRICGLIGSYIGDPGEPAISFYKMIAVEGSGVCFSIDKGSSVEMTACSLSTDENGIYMYDVHLIIDSSYIDCGGYGLSFKGGTAIISNSYFHANNSWCIKSMIYSATVESMNNRYSGYGGINLYSGGSASFIEDEFRVDNYSFYASRYPPQSVMANKCLFVGGENGFYSVSPLNMDPFFIIVNCTFDSINYAIDLGNSRGSVRILNSVISRCGHAIGNADFIEAEGLVIHDCDVETLNILTPFDYYTFDPQLDSIHIATADSAKMVGVNSAFGRDAPLWDDREYWFRDAFGVPAIGWRSPYTDTGWPDPECDIITKKWGVRSPGRRLK